MSGSKVIRSQLIGSSKDIAVRRKIAVIEYFLSDEHCPMKVQETVHREILELFAIEGRTCRQISRTLKSKYPEEAQTNLRSNAQSRFGHQGIARVINRWYSKAFNYYKKKYEAT